MWTQENRARYDRTALRYPSDLTDEAWALIEPLIPPAKPDDLGQTLTVRSRPADGCLSAVSFNLSVSGQTPRDAA